MTVGEPTGQSMTSSPPGVLSSLGRAAESPGDATWSPPRPHAERFGGVGKRPRRPPEGATRDAILGVLAWVSNDPANDRA
jgi:hypothetical protein